MPLKLNLLNNLIYREYYNFNDSLFNLELINYSKSIECVNLFNKMLLGWLNLDKDKTFTILFDQQAIGILRPVLFLAQLILGRFAIICFWY